jgi:hypothetical protein
LFSKEANPSIGSLILWRAPIVMSGSPFRAVEKPMRGGFVEARGQGRWGEYLGEV